MSDFADRVRDVLDAVPDGGCVLAILPDVAHPGWSGRAVLEIAKEAARDRGPAVILDLAPDTTDLMSRVGASGGPGFAECVAGEAELWEIARRSDSHGVLYLPQGLHGSGTELATAEATRQLAEEIRGKGRVLLVLLDRFGAGAAAASGWLDGFVRLGETGAGRRPGGVPEFGRLERDRAARKPNGDGPGQGRHVPAGSEDTSEGRGQVRTEARSPPRVVLPPDLGPSRLWLRRVLKGVVGLSVLLALALTLSTLMGGPGWSAAGDAALTVVSDAAQFTGASPPPAGGGARISTGPAADSPTTAVPTREEGIDAFPRAETAEPETAVTADSPATVMDAESATNPSIPAGQPTAEETRPSDASAGIGTDRSGPSPGPADLASFRAVADSLSRSIRAYYRERDRQMDAEVGCRELRRAYDRADSLFQRLWLHRMSLESDLDSAYRSTFRTRARQMQAVVRSYDLTGCPP